MSDDDAPEAAPPSSAARPPLGQVGIMALAVAAAVVIIAIGVTLQTGTTGETAPTPERSRVTAPPVQGDDALFDLGTALPPGSEAIAGAFAPGDGGAVVTEEADFPDNPLAVVPLEGPPWATVRVSGQAVDGWSVAMGVVDGGTYWAVTVNPTARTVELVPVVGGERGEGTTYPVEGEVRAEIVVVVRGRLAQAEASGVALPTASLAEGSEMRFGLLARGDSADPGVARWSSLAVQADVPLTAPSLPPLLGARDADAATVREELGG